jgi:hypothetical protein
MTRILTSVALTALLASGLAAAPRHRATFSSDTVKR